jgi:hypothetical protein
MAWSSDAFVIIYGSVSVPEPAKSLASTSTKLPAVDAAEAAAASVD